MEAGMALAKSTDGEEIAGARGGTEEDLPLRGASSRGWLCAALSSLARTRVGVSGNFRENSNRFRTGAAALIVA